MNKLETGSFIPDFELLDQNGETFRFRDQLGKKNLVIYFYPKDETQGCTQEACSFRDSYEDFIDSDAEVIGISNDGVKSHRSFADHHRLPFTLLSDPRGRVRNLFGVPRSLLGLVPGRTTYIADMNGKIVYIFNSQIEPLKHVEIALDILKKINSNIIVKANEI
jgi:thioredoxin-dependent peroxiredoxin